MDVTFRQAGRRLDLALALKDEGDFAGAREAADAACALAPAWVDAWFVLAETCEQLRAGDDAISAYRRCLTIDPADRFGAAARLAMMGAAATPTRLPAAYVTALFDGVAARFEESLLGRLDYRVPQLLYEAVNDHRDRLPSPLAILDFGCGTGLAGEVFRPLAQRLDGVDLSPRMIDEAARKNIYDSVRTGDLLQKPDAAAPRYGLVIAADVFNYLGDLRPAFGAAASWLVAGGMLAFTIEEGATDPFDLGPGQRYRHDAAAVRAKLSASGFRLLDDREALLRLERREPVRGRILLATLEPKIPRAR
ncbi:MAG: methyltransferase [Dongiaceae bacterium]